MGDHKRQVLPTSPDFSANFPRAGIRWNLLESDFSRSLPTSSDLFDVSVLDLESNGIRWNPTSFKIPLFKILQRVALSSTRLRTNRYDRLTESVIVRPSNRPT